MNRMERLKKLKKIARNHKNTSVFRKRMASQTENRGKGLSPQAAKAIAEAIQGMMKE
ncbi:MAG: hypothetical protein ACQEQ4_06770 [Fibrobacterota bacterium]